LWFVLTVLRFSFAFTNSNISHIPTGIYDIPSKLNDMCPQFDLWNSWFGEHQKYDPSSVVESVSDDGGDAQEEEEDQNVSGDAIRDVDAIGGGQDAALSEVVMAADAATREALAVVDVRPSAVAGSNAAGHISPSPVNTSPVASGNKRNVGGAAAGSAAVMVNAAAAAKQALQSVIASPVANSSSQGSAGSGKQSFDAVYAKAAENKVMCLKEIARAKGECQLKLQANEQRFQSQKLMMEVRIGNEERRLRQRIEFEKNIANLFVADRTGALANEYMQVLRAEDERQRDRVDAADTALASFAAALQGQQ